MNIIFGDALPGLSDKYTVLELDKFRLPPNGDIVTAYCIVEKIPLQEFSKLQHLVDLHHSVVNNYRLRHWDFCLKAMAELRSHWSGELDTFYDELCERIKRLRDQDLPDEWDGVIDKTAGSNSIPLSQNSLP